MSPVTMRSRGGGAMMDSLVGDYIPATRGNLNITAFARFSDAESERKKDYHEEGVGKARIRRVFFYLNQQEADRIANAMKRVALGG